MASTATATATAIKSMDRLFRDVLANLAEEDRGKFMNACLKGIPTEMNFTEGVVVIYALAKICILELHNSENNCIIFYEGSLKGEYNCFVGGRGIPRRINSWCMNFAIDNDGRIIKLFMPCNDTDLPAVIFWLERLKDLRIWNCRSIPVELSNLPPLEKITLDCSECRSLPMELSNFPRLEKLTLENCSEQFFNNFPIQMKLQYLKVLHVDSTLPLSSPLFTWMTNKLPNLEVLDFNFDGMIGENLLDLENLSPDMCSRYLFDNFPTHTELCHLKQLFVSSGWPLSSPVLTWMTKQFPSLECLTFVGMGIDRTTLLLDHLCIPGVCFEESLQQLTICSCKVNNNHFEKILFEVLPRFQNLVSLDLDSNNITTVQPIVDRIKNDNSVVIHKSLRTLNLVHNLVSDDGHEGMRKDLNPKEKAALLSFLKTFNTIYDLGAWDFDDSDLKYAQQMNHAGRSLVEVGTNSGRSLPLSAWPIVFERAGDKTDYNFHTEKDNATELNYLVCQIGPLLISRFTNIHKCHSSKHDNVDLNTNKINVDGSKSSKNNNKINNINDDENDAQNGNHKRKRN
mmetsp:Transcript_45900/g.49531  ORF Transcript_45900/g.49531 Transcript_45900/m.49531 type:complete len:569 (-) Transcript_45900:166-1872(-)